MRNTGVEFYNGLKELEAKGLSAEDIGTIVTRNWQRERLGGIVALCLGLGFGLFISCVDQEIGDRKIARELAKKMK